MWQQEVYESSDVLSVDRSLDRKNRGSKWARILKNVICFFNLLVFKKGQFLLFVIKYNKIRENLLLCTASRLQVIHVRLCGLGLLDDVHLVIQHQMLFGQSTWSWCEDDHFWPTGQLWTEAVRSDWDTQTLFRLSSHYNCSDVHLSASCWVAAPSLFQSGFSCEDTVKTAELSDCIKTDKRVTDGTWGCSRSALVIFDGNFLLLRRSSEVGSSIAGQSEWVVWLVRWVWIRGSIASVAIAVSTWDRNCVSVH